MREIGLTLAVIIAAALWPPDRIAWLVVLLLGLGLFAIFVWIELAR